MSAQLSLLDIDSTAGAVRATDPVTSLIGSRAANVTGERARILHALDQANDGLTADDLVPMMAEGVSRNQVCSRLRLLERDNKVETFGVRVNAKGHPVQVWYVKPAGIVDVPTGGRL